MRILILMALAVGVAPQAAAQSAPADSFTTMVAVASQGDTLRGFIRVAQDAGPHLTVVLLQGFPGSANPALPAVMQAAGFNGVGFTFRGVRSSGGFYSVQGTIADAKAMVAFLRSDSARRLWRVDPDRIVLIGASAGTLSALRATADDPRIACAAAMVPFNWARTGLAGRTDTALRRRMEGTVRSLSSGPEPVLRERGLVDEVIGNAEANDLVPVGAALGNRRLMLIGARDDTTAPLPVHFTPLVEAIRQAGGVGLRDTVVNDTHNLPNAGDAVGAAIVRWLRSDCAR
jgi:uncharacterized protein